MIQAVRDSDWSIDAGSSVQETCREGGGRCEKTEDVLIKLVRVIANVAMSPEVGPLIAQSQTCVDLLIQILGESTYDQYEYDGVQTCQVRTGQNQ